MTAETIWREYLRVSEQPLAGSPCLVAPHSAIMTELADQITEIGSGEGVVLLLGESGLAKGCHAEAIHAASPRYAKRLASIWCVGLERFDFEGIFGDADHARRSVIGAHRQSILDAARGGSLFFNEVGALNAAMQEVLLQIVSNGGFERGIHGPVVKINARIIASSSLDLVEAVNEGRFREDLYYRLSTAPISVPPLRARSDRDLIQLLDHVTRGLALELHGSPSRLSQVALERLLRYSWPGNIREMRNVMERAMFAARGHDAIALSHLPPEVRDPLGFDGEYVPRTLDELERLHIERTLRRHRQNRTHAANELGISRATLIKKVREYGLAPGHGGRRPNAEGEPAQ